MIIIAVQVMIMFILVMHIIPIVNSIIDLSLHPFGENFYKFIYKQQIPSEGGDLSFISLLITINQASL